MARLKEGPTVPPLDIDLQDDPEAPDAPPVLVVTCRGREPWCRRFRVETTDTATAQWSAGNHLQGHVRQATAREVPR